MLKGKPLSKRREEAMSKAESSPSNDQGESDQSGVTTVVKTTEPKYEREPGALSTEYHKARKQLMLWAGILLIWEFVGFDLSKAQTADGKKGKFELVKIAGMTIGRATYEPGWKWSEHVSPIAGTEFCEVGHVGIVISGKATAAMKDGEVYELGPGTIFHVPAAPHDSWVVGDEPYVSLHFLGADSYTK